MDFEQEKAGTTLIEYGLDAQLDDLVQNMSFDWNLRNPPTLDEFMDQKLPQDHEHWEATLSLGFSTNRLYLDPHGRIRVTGSPEPETIPEPGPEEIILTLDEDGALG